MCGAALAVEESLGQAGIAGGALALHPGDGFEIQAGFKLLLGLFGVVARHALFSQRYLSIVQGLRLLVPLLDYQHVANGETNYGD